MSELIYVIIPVYNVASYLNRCVQSIINQTYKNLKIILVDDGSTDESGNICDKWSEKDSRIIVIHQNNMGQSGARNTGLSSIYFEQSINNHKDSYVTFVDSDDWIEAEIIEKAEQKINFDNADVIIWGYSADFVNLNDEIYHSKSYAVPNCLLSNGLTKDTVVYNEVRAIHGYAWNKLYRVSFIQKYLLNFPIGIYIIEDMLFNIEVIKHNAKLSYLPDIATHYIHRKRETLGTKYHPDNFKVRCKAIDGWVDVFKILCVDNNTINNYKKKERFYAVISNIRAIAKAKIFKKSIKLVMINDFLQSDIVKRIILEFTPCTIKEIILYYLCVTYCNKILLYLLQ